MFALEYEEEIWRQDAACARLGVPTGIFFSEDLGDIAQAKGICAECPVLAPCLETAIERREPWAANCSATATSWPPSGAGAGHRRCPGPKISSPWCPFRPTFRSNSVQPESRSPSATVAGHPRPGHGEFGSPKRSGVTLRRASARGRAPRGPATSGPIAARAGPRLPSPTCGGYSSSV